MDTPRRVLDPQLFPHKDMFTHATTDLVDTGLDMYTTSGGTLISNRMYLSLKTAEEVGNVYGVTFRDLPSLEHAEQALKTLAESDLLASLTEENHALRQAIMALVKTRLMPKAAAEAIEKAMGKNFTAEELAIVKSIKLIGV